MAMQIQPSSESVFAHSCVLPWPIDPEVPQGHVCECGRTWVYQPARWDPLLTLEELRLRQEAGEFLRGIIPRFKPKPPESGVIVPLPQAKGGPASP